MDMYIQVSSFQIEKEIAQDLHEIHTRWEIFNKYEMRGLYGSFYMYHSFLVLSDELYTASF